MSKMGGSIYNPQAVELRNNYPNIWHTELLRAPVADCPCKRVCPSSCPVETPTLAGLTQKKERS